MSYTSTSVLQRSATVAQVREIIDLLGYKQARKDEGWGRILYRA